MKASALAHHTGRARPDGTPDLRAALAAAHGQPSWAQAFFGRTFPRELPPDIQSNIRVYDRSSEILMRWVQLAVVLIFGVLYFASPKAAGSSFSLVPVAISAYFTVTLAGLIWSLRRETPDWAAYVSIVIDVGLLMTLIWSFHRQYGQPPSFYLKVPTFLYLFIFVALRALRFDPKFVLAAGSVAIVAWAIMVFMAVPFDAATSTITRDYVTYLTSNTVLVGAEIDKLVSVGMVTGILYLVLRRGRAFLIQAISEQAAAANLSRFFDEPVASLIRANDIGARGARREAAILFIDIRGFTQMSTETEPAIVIDILEEYQRKIVPLIRAHGGVIDKFMGDGVMATFGAVTESASYAADAMRAIDAVLADAADWATNQGVLSSLPPRSVSAAVAAGKVICGAVGDGARLDFTVIGSAVNLAAKLEKMNKPLGSRALTTAATFSLAVRQGYLPAQETHSVRREIDGVLGAQAVVVLHA